MNKKINIVLIVITIVFAITGTSRYIINKKISNENNQLVSETKSQTKQFKKSLFNQIHREVANTDIIENDIDNKQEKNIRIYCYGDSITEGFNSTEDIAFVNNEYIDISYTTYPKVLSSLSGLTTYNYGFNGLTSSQIVKIYEDIKSGADYSCINLGNEDVIINNWDDAEKLDYTDYELEIKDDVRKYSLKHGLDTESDIVLIMIGSNGGWDDGYELSMQIQHMLNLSNCKNYIVIGDTEEHWEEANSLEKTDVEIILENVFGDKFFNARLYMLNNTYNFTNIKPSQEDINALSIGSFPNFLRSDDTHLTGYGYYLLAQGIYSKCLDLNYF